LEGFEVCLGDFGHGYMMRLIPAPNSPLPPSKILPFLLQNPFFGEKNS